MQAVDFLRFLWAPDRPACFSIATQPFGAGRDRHRRKRFRTIEAAASYAAQRAANHDVWHTCAILKEDAGHSGKADLLASRAFYLDLDVKPSAYPTRNDAARAAVRFTADAGLPAPNAIVTSGGGLHVYWITDTLLPPAEWSPLGLAMRGLALQHGLHLDTNVPGDMARILRTPGTFNSKDPTGLRPVTVIHCSGTYVQLTAMRAALARVPVPSLSLGQTPAAGRSDLSAGLYDEKPRSMAGVVRECPALQDMLLKAGNVGGYPLWRDMLSIAAHTTDGHRFVEPMSKAHPTYTVEALGRQWEDAKRRKADGSMGPATCDTIAASGQSHLCAACRHRGHIKSPVRLASDLIVPPPAGTTTPGVAVQFAALFHPDATHYYFDAAACQYRVLTEDKDEDEKPRRWLKPVLNGWISQIERHYTEGQAVLRLRYHKTPSDRLGDVIRLQLEKTTNRNEGYIVGAGLLPEFGQHKEVIKMLLSWSQRLAQSQNQIAVTHYGWVNHNNQHAFALGDRVFWPNGTETPSLVDADDTPLFKPQGTLDGWRAIAQKYHDAFSAPLRVVLVASLASPLVGFSGNGGARVLSAYSHESGHGKSRASIIAQSVWGHPDHCRIRSQATPAAVQKLAGRYHSLPLLWDDVRSTSVPGQNDILQQLLFQMVEGSEKRRYTDPHRPGSWNCLTIITSNHSMRAKARNAQSVGQRDTVEGPELARILELQVPPYTRKTNLELAPVYDNFGQAGPVFAAHVTGNQPAVARLVQSIEAAIAKTFPHEACRFHVSTVACLLAAAKVSTDLNLVRFDMASLWTCLEQALRSIVENDEIMSQRKTAEQYSEDDMFDLLAAFLNKYDDRTLITARPSAAMGKINQPPPMVVKEPSPGRRPDSYGAIVVDIALDTGEMLLHPKALRDFAIASQREPDFVRDMMRRQFGASSAPRRMGAFLTKYERVRQRVVVLDMQASPRLAEYLGDLRSAPAVASFNLPPLSQPVVH